MIAIRPQLQIAEHEGLRRYLNDDAATDSDRKEVAAYQRYLADHAGDRLFPIVSKAVAIRVFGNVMDRLALPEAAPATVLELAGAQGWAACLVKRRWPHCYVVASDLKPEVLSFCAEFERLLDVRVDEKWAVNCRDLPFADEQFDLLFTFMAFHHLGDCGGYANTLREMVRVLKPGGRAVLLCEPCAPRLLYPLALRRANAIRECVDEDVLVLADLRRGAADLGCRLQVEFYPYHRERTGLGQMLYFRVLSRLGPLGRILPNTVNITICR